MADKNESYFFNRGENLDLSLTLDIDDLTDRLKSASEINEKNRLRAEENLDKYRRKLDDKRIKDLYREAYDTQTKLYEKSQSMFMRGLHNALDSVRGEYEAMMKQYTENQQKLSFGLLGSNMTYEGIVKNLNVLTSNAYIKQNDVYKNLSNLISQGITVNASQRAFLQTASQQVGLAFDATNESLNRLINLQKTDFSESRVAQMAGLKTFLQQNYQTSQYIHQGFQTVSAALLEAQSMMTASSAMAVESTVQKWLGAFSSGGASSNTVSGLANAIGALGSGDVSALSGNMGNLIAMGAARSGLSYGQLLTGGLSEADTNALMGGIVNYIANMNTNSNVATNAIAKIFGVNVSDIQAAKNTNAGWLSGQNVNYGINDFLKSIVDTTNLSTGYDIALSNRLSGAALNTNYGLYRLVNFGAGLANDWLGGTATGMGLNALTGGRLGYMLQNSGNIQLLGHLIGGVANDWGDIINSFKGSDSSNIFGKLGDALWTALGIGDTNLISDYNSLGKNWDIGFKTAGSGGSSRGSGTGKSFSGSKGNVENLQSSVSSSGESLFTGAEVTRSLNDVYDLLLTTNDILGEPLVTVSHIAEAGNAVVIGSAENTRYISDMLTITAVSAQNIYALLENYFTGAENSITDMSTVDLKYTWGSWAGAAGK